MPTVWVFGRDSHHAREMAARAKRLWESEPLPWMVQEESYLNPILLTASLPFGLYPERRTIKMLRSEEHTSELQSLMRISYAVFCLKKKIAPYTSKTNTLPTRIPHNYTTIIIHKIQTNT